MEISTKGKRDFERGGIYMDITGTMASMVRRTGSVKTTGGSVGRDERKARRRAAQAEMHFRISKGDEQDNIFTRIQYFLKPD